MTEDVQEVAYLIITFFALLILIGYGISKGANWLQKKMFPPDDNDIISRN